MTSALGHMERYKTDSIFNSMENNKIRWCQVCHLPSENQVPLGQLWQPGEVDAPEFSTRIRRRYLGQCPEQFQL